MAGELFLLPRAVIASKEFGQMVISVFDVVSKYISNNVPAVENFRKIARDIDLDSFADLLDKDSVIALYMEIYEKDVFVQELQQYLR